MVWDFRFTGSCQVPPATSPVEAPMDIAPEVVPETKKKYLGPFVGNVQQESTQITLKSWGRFQFYHVQMRTDGNQLPPGRDCLLTLYPTIKIEDLTRYRKMRDTTSEHMPRDKSYEKWNASGKTKYSCSLYRYL